MRKFLKSPFLFGAVFFVCIADLSFASPVLPQKITGGHDPSYNAEAEAAEIEEIKRDQATKDSRPKKLLKIESWELLFELKDYLSIRMGIRELMMQAELKKNPKLWGQLRELFLQHPAVGQDLRSLWDKLGPRHTRAQTQLELQLRNADRFFSLGDNARALKSLLAIGKSLEAAKSTSKLRYRDTSHFESALRLEIARALYAESQFKLAALIYDSIPASFYDISQVLYEKVWANYKAGRLDWALGHLTSLQSGYFGKILPPDLFLVGTYAAWELCQDELARNLTRSFVQNLKSLRSRRSQFHDVHGGDPVALALRQTLESTEFIEKFSDLFTPDERESERKEIASFLLKETDRKHAELLKAYEKILPYFRAAAKVRPYLLKKFIAARGEIFDGPYNISRFQRGEVWADDVGHILFRPQSTCKDGQDFFALEKNIPELPSGIRSLYYSVRDFSEYYARESQRRMFFYPEY